MKVVINKGVLESIISNTNPYLDKKDLSSITSHILLCAKGGTLYIKATDHEIGLSYKIKNVVIENDGYATANGAKLLSAIKGLNDEDVTLEVMNNSLFVKQKRSKYKLPMYNYEDFPEFPTTQNKDKFDINTMIFGRSLKKIFSSIDTSNPKYELNGALIDIKDGFINLVGTDTKRLSIYKLKTTTNANSKNIIIPKKAIAEIQKLFSDKIEIYYDETVLLAVSENFEFFTKLINGKYPDYARVVPSETAFNVQISRDKMIEGIKAVSSMCEQMKITIKNDGILFESINEDNSEAKTEIEVVNDISENIVFGIKNRFLLDFLTNIEENSFLLEFNNPESAFVVSSGDLKTVMMPINL
ncbi:MAG: DNA polymerase III subunit beta [Campylobacter sp.]|nr:DNA polymerase III subunit beta [Campylobacter sp.]